MYTASSAACGRGPVGDADRFLIPARCVARVERSVRSRFPDHLPSHLMPFPRVSASARFALQLAPARSRGRDRFSLPAAQVRAVLAASATIATLWPARRRSRSHGRYAADSLVPQVGAAPLSAAPSARSPCLGPRRLPPYRDRAGQPDPAASLRCAPLSTLATVLAHRPTPALPSAGGLARRGELAICARAALGIVACARSTAHALISDLLVRCFGLASVPAALTPWRHVPLAQRSAQAFAAIGAAPRARA